MERKLNCKYLTKMPILLKIKTVNFTPRHESDIIKTTVEGGRRILSRPVKKKQPVHSDLLIKLFDLHHDKNSLKELRLLTMCF